MRTSRFCAQHCITPAIEDSAIQDIAWMMGGRIPGRDGQCAVPCDGAVRDGRLVIPRQRAGRPVKKRSRAWTASIMAQILAPNAFELTLDGSRTRSWGSQCSTCSLGRWCKQVRLARRSGKAGDTSTGRTVPQSTSQQCNRSESMQLAATVRCGSDRRPQSMHDARTYDKVEGQVWVLC